jgi:2-polyprenyl-6-methoxyphenol hydroxylase-like FAD-dependent oxidoreductase
MNYDAIVVGARCAGAPTAMLLARRGYRVLLVDKATFPSDTMSGHYIHPPGVARLKRWGLLGRVAGTHCPPITTTRVDLGAFRLTGSPPAAQGVAEGLCVRRKYLDQILVEAAVEAGAELREGFTVSGLQCDGGSVSGLRGSSRSGTEVTETARVVIGADGMRSVVARLVRAAEYNVVEPLTCNYYAYWSGVKLEGAELHPHDGRFVIGAPTNDGLTILNVLWPRAEFRRVRADIEGNFLESLDLSPDFAARVRAGTREECFVGTADTPNFFRKPHGPGWALVGDAGYHKDPITAQGMTDAFRDAELLAEALDAGFRGRRLLEDALADYQRQRDRIAAPMYEMTCQMARLASPSPDQRLLFEALRDNPCDTDRFLGTIAGTVPIQEFYSPGNLRRIVAAAARVGGVSEADPQVCPASIRGVISAASAC